MATFEDSVFVLIVTDPSSREGYTLGGLFWSEEAAHAAFVENYGDDTGVTENIHESFISDRED